MQWVAYICKSHSSTVSQKKTHGFWFTDDPTIASSDKALWLMVGLPSPTPSFIACRSAVDRVNHDYGFSNQITTSDYDLTFA